MKIIALIAGGRAGTDLFQSLLDQHPEISQFPGAFYFDEFIKKIKDEKNLAVIAKSLVKNYKHFFDSKDNFWERHNMLGKNKNEFYLVDENFFINNFIDLMKNKNLNEKNILIYLNLAYSKSSGESIKEKKIVIINLHHIERLKKFENIECEIIYTTRDPLAMYASAFKRKQNNESYKNLSPWAYYYNINRIFNGITNVIYYKKKTYVMQLEKLHLENELTMKNFCSIFNISYNKTMRQSTYHGKDWWGDEQSGKDLSGINPNFKNNIDMGLFFKKDIEHIENYLKFFLIEYNYPFRSTKSNYFIYKFLPFKIELILLKESIMSLNIKRVVLLFYFFFKRLILIRKKINNKINFPTSLGIKD